MRDKSDSLDRVNGAWLVARCFEVFQRRNQIDLGWLMTGRATEVLEALEKRVAVVLKLTGHYYTNW